MFRMTSCVIAGHDHVIAGHEHVIAGHDHVIAGHEHVIAGLTRNLRCRIRVRHDEKVRNDGHKVIIPNNIIPGLTGVIPNNVIPGFPALIVIPGLTRDLTQTMYSIDFKRITRPPQKRRLRRILL